MKNNLRIQFETPYNTSESMISIIDIVDSEVFVYFPLLSIHKIYNNVNDYVFEININDNSVIYKHINTYNNLACVSFNYKQNQYYEYCKLCDIEDNVSKIDILMYPVKSNIDISGEYNRNIFIYDWCELGNTTIIIDDVLKINNKLNYSQGFIFSEIISRYDYSTYDVFCNISIIDINDNILYNSLDMTVNEFSNIVYDETSCTYISSWVTDVSNILKKDDLVIPFEFGMQLASQIRIVHKDALFEEDEIISQTSNYIPITTDIYQDMLFWMNIQDNNSIETTTLEYKDVESIIDNVTKYIEEDEMNKINIVSKSVINTIETNISGSSQGIIKPVFYRYVDSENIILRKGVVDKIQLNLDIYKSKVESFNISIDSISYPEIGRVHGGVIFSIDCSNLISDGRYFIMNQDYEVVTSGTYKLE